MEKEQKNFINKYFIILFVGVVILSIISIYSFLTRITIANVHLGWISIEKNYLNIIINMMYFILSILYIAISFKVVSIWKVSFTSYIYIKYKKIVQNFLGSVIILIIYMTLNIFQLINLNIFILLIIYAYLIMSIGTMIFIIFKELYSAGNTNKMNKNVMEILKNDYTLVLKIMNIDYEKKNDSNYYSYLRILKTKELIKIQKTLVDELGFISVLEIEIIKEIIRRDKENQTTYLSNIPNINKYLNYIFSDNDKQELDLEICKYMDIKNNTEEINLLVEIILKVMDKTPNKVSNVFNPQMQEILTVNEILIDKIIIRCLYEPTSNRELFLLGLFETSLYNSAFEIKNNVIKINTKLDKTIHIRLGNINYIVKNNDKLEELSFEKYNDFWNKINNTSNVELLSCIQEELYLMNLEVESMTGIYKKDYFDVLKKYDAMSKKINEICNRLDPRKEIIDYQKTPFNYKLNSKNINYNNLTNEEKEKFNKIAEILKKELGNIKRIKLKNVETEKNKLINQINNTHEFSIEIFLKLYKYIIENKVDNSKLSKEFYISFKNIFDDNDFIIHESLEVYLLNVHFKLQDKFMRNYGINEVINFRICDNKKEIPNLKNHLTFLDVFNLNRAITIIQYYVDKDKLPKIENYMNDSDISVGNIQAACKIIEINYGYLKNRTNEKVNDTENLLPNYIDYKIVRFQHEGLKNTEKIYNILSDNLSMKFERRTVFWVLLKRLLKIETALVFSDYENYEQKVNKLLDEVLEKVQ